MLRVHRQNQIALANALDRSCRAVGHQHERAWREALVVMNQCPEERHVVDVLFLDGHIVDPVLAGQMSAIHQRQLTIGTREMFADVQFRGRNPLLAVGAEEFVPRGRPNEFLMSPLVGDGEFQDVRVEVVDGPKDDPPSARLDFRTWPVGNDHANQIAQAHSASSRGMGTRSPGRAMGSDPFRRLEGLHVGRIHRTVGSRTFGLKANQPPRPRIDLGFAGSPAQVIGQHPLPDPDRLNRAGRRLSRCRRGCPGNAWRYARRRSMERPDRLFAENRGDEKTRCKPPKPVCAPIFPPTRLRCPRGKTGPRCSHRFISSIMSVAM